LRETGKDFSAFDAARRLFDFVDGERDEDTEIHCRRRRVRGGDAERLNFSA